MVWGKYLYLSKNHIPIVMETNLDRISDHILRPNDLVLLNFPEGLIPIRVLNTEFFQFLYDPLSEGQISTEVPASTSVDGAKDLGFVSPQLFKSAILAAQPVNVFRIDKPSILYQVFVGIAPSYARVFFALPSTASQKNLEIISWSSAYSAFGWVDGFISPLNEPDPQSEAIFPYGVDPAIGYANPLQEPIRPLLMFYVNRVAYGVVADVDLVVEMLDKRGRGERTFMKTVGGLTRFTYPYRDVFKITPIPIGATRDQISRILRGG
jgi:hypothetical protein